MDAIAQVWSSADYGPTADRLAGTVPTVIAAVERHVPTGSLVADLGAGHGQLARILAARDYDVLAVEPTPALREVGQLELLEVTEQLLPWSHEDVDAAIDWVLHGSPAHTAALARAGGRR